MEDIRQHVRNKTAAFIDARSSRDFKRGHLRGAMNVPAGQIETYLPEIQRRIAPNELIIIYCSGPRCDSGEMVYEYLASRGYVDMRVFKPGWEALAQASDLAEANP